MTMPEQLDTVLADMRSDAQVLRRNKDERTASILETWARRFADASEDYRTFLGETDAMLRAGLRKPDALRRQFAVWAAQGHAYTDTRGRRFYRKLIVPERPHVRAARAAGRRGETGVPNVA
jgi:hypothetical protein